MPDAHDMPQANYLLQLADELIQASLAHFAAVCKENGRLSTAKLDQHQPALYELAYQATKRLAASQLVAYAQAEQNSLAGPLAAIYVAETIHDLASWQFREADFGLAEGAIGKMLAETAVSTFLSHHLSHANYEALASQLATSTYAIDDDLTAEHREFQQLLRRFASDRIAPQAEGIHREDRDVPQQFIDELAEMGCYGLSIPARYGGFQDDDQPDHLMMVIASDELSRASFGTAGSLITRPELLAKAILMGGTEAQKQKWLPMIATGQLQTAVAITEPDYGSNVAGLTTKADKVDGGWRLSGTKMWCTYAGRAEIMMVLTRTDPDRSLGHKGLSLFIVEKPAAAGHHFAHTTNGGSIQGRAIATIGYRGMHSYEVVFDNYFVPNANVIGGETGLGRGFYLQMHGFAGSRLQTAGRALGLMGAAFSTGLQYIHERHVFNQPLLSYPLVRRRLVSLAAQIQACRRLTFLAAAELDARRGDMAAAMAKLLTAQTAEIVTRQVQQWHGGMGYAEEFPISRHFVDARVLAIFEGAEEVLALRVIARTLLRQTKRDAIFAKDGISSAKI